MVAILLNTAWGRSPEVSNSGSYPLDPRSILGPAMLDGSFILATSAIHLITMVLACLSGVM